MNDKKRWTLSVGGASLIYAGFFTAAFMTEENRFESAAVAVELRLPSRSADAGVLKNKPLRKSVSAATDPVNPAVGQSSANTEEIAAFAESGCGQTAARLSADEGQNGEQRPQIDFVTACAGVVLPMPGYPAAALRRRIEGSVTVRVTVAADGTVTETEVIRSSHEWFRREVIAVVSRWHFPPRAGGFVTEKHFVFRLEES